MMVWCSIDAMIYRHKNYECAYHLGQSFLLIHSPGLPTTGCGTNCACFGARY
jgi:hypothetical protein